MTDLNYTREVHSTAIDTSSLVDEVFYNENTNDLYVDLYDKIYKYSNVTSDVVREFSAADSAGNFYNTVIKKKFGPGEHIGDWMSVDYREVDVETEVEPQATYVTNVSLLTPDQAREAFGVNTANSTTTFSLKPFPEAVEVEGVERRYVVQFEVEETGSVKPYETKAKSLDEAVNALLEIAKMVDLTFIVREVTVYFE